MNMVGVVLEKLGPRPALILVEGMPGGKQDVVARIFHDDDLLEGVLTVVDLREKGVVVTAVVPGRHHK